MRILIVEDNPATLDLLNRSLTEAGHDVALAPRQESGLQLAAEREFDLAILDVTLPDGSGLDLCRELRARGMRFPILFLTAHNEVESRIAGLDAGGDDYLKKPFAIAELRARIRALGRRGGLAPPASLASGDTAIDFSARSFRAGGSEVTLTSREWSVLEVLAANAGRVVSRDEIIEAAWPNPGPGAAESFVVIVSRLRRKLGGEEDLRIRTVRGEGVILEVMK